MTNKTTYMWQSQKFISWKGVSRREAVHGNARPITNGSWKNEQPDVSGNVINEDGNAFKSRPIKHWRKQLVPDENRGGTKSKLIDDTSKPGGTIYLGGTVNEENTCCNKEVSTAQRGYAIVAPISINKNNIICNAMPCSYIVTAEDIENGWNGPIGKKICCTPETSVIKSATTILSKKYYTDSRSYLKSRAKLYEQKLSTHPKNGIQYYSSNGKLLYPNDEVDGPQTFLTGSYVNSYYSSIHMAEGAAAVAAARADADAAVAAARADADAVVAAARAEADAAVEAAIVRSESVPEVTAIRDAGAAAVAAALADGAAVVAAVRANGVTAVTAAMDAGDAAVTAARAEIVAAELSSKPTTIYKPNNRQYGVQGGVSSSTRIEKLKRDTVQTNASSFRAFFGEAAANAGSYKLNGNAPYFIKNKYAAL